jgi:thioredoxin
LESDSEIERIKQRKLVELMRKGLTQPKNDEVSGKQTSLTNQPIELTDATFQDTVKRSQLLVVDFWAPWCAPCRWVSPILDQLAKEHSGKVTFAKLNVDENPVVPSQFQIEGIPTILIFKNGSMVDAIVGAAAKDFIESKIKAQMTTGVEGSSLY